MSKVVSFILKYPFFSYSFNRMLFFDRSFLEKYKFPDFTHLKNTFALNFGGFSSPFLIGKSLSNTWSSIVLLVNLSEKSESLKNYCEIWFGPKLTVQLVADWEFRVIFIFLSPINQCHFSSNSLWTFYSSFLNVT